ncbi:MAG: heme exporter protein CcmD [Afipia sp.]|nr:heme exporter protein CcmD [Afipia sp.]OJW63087.1 MAG: heme exporter protein CcmD [Afipia sp. 64-13]
MHLLASLGPYADFILASYGLVAVVVIALILWIVIDQRHQEKALRDLEASGVTRRSASRSGEPS